MEIGKARLTILIYHKEKPYIRATKLFVENGSYGKLSPCKQRQLIRSMNKRVQFTLDSIRAACEEKGASFIDAGPADAHGRVYIGTCKVHFRCAHPDCEIIATRCLLSLRKRGLYFCQHHTTKAVIESRESKRHIANVLATDENETEIHQEPSTDTVQMTEDRKMSADELNEMNDGEIDEEVIEIQRDETMSEPRQEAVDTMQAIETLKQKLSGVPRFKYKDKTYFFAKAAANVLGFKDAKRSIEDHSDTDERHHLSDFIEGGGSTPPPCAQRRYHESQRRIKYTTTHQID